MVESSHQPKYFPTYCRFQGLGTCPKTKGRSVVDPTAWPFHRRKPSNILFPSIQWQMLFPFQPGVVVRHENPKCVWLLTLRCVFQVVAKTIIDFNFHLAINHDPHFGKGMKLSRRSLTQSRYTGKREFQRIQTSLSIIHMCQRFVKGCSLRKKQVAPGLSEQIGATQSNFRVSTTFACCWQRTLDSKTGQLQRLCSPVNPTTQLLPIQHCLIQGPIKRRTTSQTFQGTWKFPDVGQGCSRKSIHTCFIPKEIYQSARISTAFTAHKFYQNEW